MYVNVITQVHVAQVKKVIIGCDRSMQNCEKDVTSPCLVLVFVHSACFKMISTEFAKFL